jgi:HEAT repeat protein
MASFKTDESFLEKISIGAIGTQRVFEQLQLLGHKPIELERGSMNYKIWKKIKIKRIRVPDLLCVDNGIRIESRAKSKLEITMSHSFSDSERGWDFGMKDDDYVALVVCEKTGDKPIDWKADNLVQFISVKALKIAEKNNNVTFIKPKGAQEGFEARISWPSGYAKANGTVTEINPQSLKYKTETGILRFIRLTKGTKVLMPLVKVGDSIVPNQILASVVNISQNLPKKTVNEINFLENLKSLILSERYAAAKALSFFNIKIVIDALKAKINDQNEHIYIKLEAAASLARNGYDEGYDFIDKCLKDQYLQNVLEAVIVLNEIKTDRACKMLCMILQNETNDPEIRAGAAWGLGEQQNKTGLTAVIQSFNAFEENIKIEAARALAKLAKNFASDILGKFENAQTTEKPGIAWALTKSNSLKIEQLISNLKDLESRYWISYIIGSLGEEKYIQEIEKLKNRDKEVYFAVTLLWKLMTSWVYELKEY